MLLYVRNYDDLASEELATFGLHSADPFREQMPTIEANEAGAALHTVLVSGRGRRRQRMCVGHTGASRQLTPAVNGLRGMVKTRKPATSVPLTNSSQGSLYLG